MISSGRHRANHDLGAKQEVDRFLIAGYAGESYSIDTARLSFGNFALWVTHAA